MKIELIDYEQVKQFETDNKVEIRIFNRNGNFVAMLVPLTGNHFIECFIAQGMLSDNAASAGTAREAIEKLIHNISRAAFVIKNNQGNVIQDPIDIPDFHILITYHP